jgi:hypothetical protein
VSAPSQSLTVRVPLAIRQRGGRKVIVMPSGVPTHAVQRYTRADPTLVKALARAFRWKRLLENGTYASISEMASTEKIGRGCLGRILLLTLLAPDIVEEILDAQHPADLTLPRSMKPFPVIWGEQRLALTLSQIEHGRHSGKP